jgi:hypothetical protein
VCQRYLTERAIQIDSPSLSSFHAASEDVDIASQGSLPVDSDITLQHADEFPDRQHVERSLLRKLDLRMSILVLIYTLSFVSPVVT